MLLDVGLGLGLMGYRFGIGFVGYRFGIGFMGYRFGIGFYMDFLPKKQKYILTVGPIYGLSTRNM